MKIEYVKGDATKPIGEGTKIIAHCCNNIGAWGSGFVTAISKKWSKPEKEYRSLQNYVLGDVQLVEVELDITIANIIGQNGVRSSTNPVPVRYDALEKGLLYIKMMMDLGNGLFDTSLHMPKMGSGLAGGDWNKVEEIVNKVFGDSEYKVYVYDYTTLETFLD